MDFVYVFFDENNWEDMIIFLSKEDAINKSKECPKARVEIFSITNKLGSGLGALAIGAWFLIHEYIPFGIETPFFNSFEIYHAISVFV